MRNPNTNVRALLLPALVAVLTGCTSGATATNAEAGGTSEDCAAPQTAVVTCGDAANPDAGFCKGTPRDFWCHPDGSPPPSNPYTYDCGLGEETGEYPVGCVVTLPSINPYYPCGGQTCGCEPTPTLDDAGRVVQVVAWTCGL